MLIAVDMVIQDLTSSYLTDLEIRGERSEALHEFKIHALELTNVGIFDSSEDLESYLLDLQGNLPQIEEILSDEIATDYIIEPEAYRIFDTHRSRCSEMLKDSGMIYTTLLEGIHLSVQLFWREKGVEAVADLFEIVNKNIEEMLLNL